MPLPLPVPVDLGQGPALVLLPGFALMPQTYGGLARLLARRARVVVPDLYGLRGPWRFEEVVARLAVTLEQRGLERVTLIAHSFGGGIQLRYMAEHAERVEQAVFVDTLAVAREWVLAGEALSHPAHLVRMATRQAAAAFLHTACLHPRQLVEAAWWGFTSARQADIDAVARSGVACHVLWANRDSLLSRSDGAQFAAELGASFDLVSGTAHRVDHDWMYRHPDLFVRHLDRLGLGALSGPG